MLLSILLVFKILSRSGTSYVSENIVVVLEKVKHGITKMLKVRAQFLYSFMKQNAKLDKLNDQN